MAKKKFSFDTARVVADAGMIRRVLAFAAVSDVRYYLCGVCIRPSQSGGVLIIASDGHTALILHDKNGRADKEVILPLSKREHIRLLSRNGEQRVCVSQEDSIYFSDKIGFASYICPDTPIEGKFPDIAKAIGDVDAFVPGMPGEFNPKYIKKALEACTDANYHGIRFFHQPEKVDSSAALFTVPDGFGLVMPLKTGKGLNEYVTADFRQAA